MATVFFLLHCFSDVLFELTVFCVLFFFFRHTGISCSSLRHACTNISLSLSLSLPVTLTSVVSPEVEVGLELFEKGRDEAPVYRVGREANETEVAL